jgi:hypothetical protein
MGPRADSTRFLFGFMALADGFTAVQAEAFKVKDFVVKDTGENRLNGLKHLYPDYYYLIYPDGLSKKTKDLPS